MQKLFPNGANDIAEMVNKIYRFLSKKIHTLCCSNHAILFKFCKLLVIVVSKELQIVLCTYTVSNRNGNLKSLNAKSHVKSWCSNRYPIVIVLLPLQMLTSEIRNFICNSIINVHAKASKIWTLSDNSNKKKYSAVCQKGVIHFWQSVDDILEDVSVAKTIIWCKNINQRTSIYRCSKIYGNPTH